MKKNSKEPDTMSRIVALCKRRGIVFQSSEIYGGVGSTFDYGPYGVEMKNNISHLWWNEMILAHDNIVGLDSAVILHPKVWEASGHLEHFSDPMVDCRNCKSRIRTDDFFGEDIRDFFKKFYEKKNKNDSEKTIGIIIASEALKYFGSKDSTFIAYTDSEIEPARSAINVFWNSIPIKVIHLFPCPICGEIGSLTESRQFNLMFETDIGPVADDNSKAYFRPETCQGIFLDYKIVHESARLKLPFGIAQIGKAFRNEITTGNFIFRTREFEQMEMQFFVRPGETSKWIDYWRERRFDWYVSLGVEKDKLRWLQHPEDKLAHYAKEAWDVEYRFPFGWGEIEGVHDRGDFDISAHAKTTEPDKEPKDSKLAYFDDETREKFIPHIVETSAGLNRTMLMLLVDAYKEDEQAGDQRVFLALDPKVAPIKAAILPLVKKDGLADLGRELADGLRGRLPIFFDAQGSIGRRYRRMDELGTPFAFTLDYQTLEDGTVTVRWRDTLEQERIGKDQIGNYLFDKLGAVNT